MARFRKKARARRSYSGSRRTRRRGGMGGMLGSVTKPLIGAGAVVAYERFVSPYLPMSNGLLKNLIELTAGAMLSNKGGIIGSGAQSLVAINAYKIVAGLTGGMAAGQSSTTVIYG